MECKVCGSKDIAFISKYSDEQNEYGCIECGRTIITKPENEDKSIKV
jgi:DNA-directed RNA polymerase subunit RPC12/RpoP